MQQNPNLFSGLGPFAGLAQAGSQLATRGIQGLFGIKDPVLERNRILSQVNYDDPASIRAAAQALMAQGDVDAGMQLAGQARQIEQQERTFGLEQRRVAVAEEGADVQRERLEIAEEDLKIKRTEVNARKDLTEVQKRKAQAELDRLDKNYRPTLYRDNKGNALFNREGEVGMFYFDEESGKIERHKAADGLTTIKPPTPNQYDFLNTARALAADRENQAKTGNQPLAAGQPQQTGGFPGISAEAVRAAQAEKERRRKEREGR